jgi:hypothetical protein
MLTTIHIFSDGLLTINVPLYVVVFVVFSIPCYFIIDRSGESVSVFLVSILSYLTSYN